MLRIYRLPNGRTYQYEEGDQPADAVQVAKASEPDTPEKRASKAAARKRAPKKAEEV